jgi:hypothetical protein
MYRHRQSSRLLPAAALVMAIAVVIAALSGQRLAVFVPLAAGALVLALVTLCFSSLTVEVGADDLVWFFGRGIWRKRIARADIASAAAVRNPWSYGFGIHRTPRGWLYNVGGLDAVEIALASGRTLRIGSDEPDVLAQALRRR